MKSKLLIYIGRDRHKPNKQDP